ncbi:hypothetical protein ACWIUA_12225, partial [Ursidibacter sp. B-7004-1]
EFDEQFMEIIPDPIPQPSRVIEVEYEEVIEHNAIRLVEREISQQADEDVDEGLSVFDIALANQAKLKTVK